MSDHPLGATYAGVLLFIVGVGLAGAIYEGRRQDAGRFEGWTPAAGSVTDLLTRATPRGPVSTAVIAFTTASGERITFTAANSHGRAAYALHAAVPVLYQPDHPQDAIVDPRTRQWMRTALAGSAALALMCLGGYVAWYASRRGRMPPPTTT